MSNRIRYEFAQYDRFDCLKPPLLLWVAVFFLSRAFALPLLAGICSSAGASNMQSLAAGHVGVDTLLPAPLALIIPCVLMRRVPSASWLPRWVWSHGRIFLASSALLNLGLLLRAALQKDGSHAQLNEWSVLAAVFDVYFLVYVLASRRVRDAFAEFPAPAPASAAITR